MLVKARPSAAPPVSWTGFYAGLGRRLPLDARGPDHDVGVQCRPTGQPRRRPRLRSARWHRPAVRVACRLRPTICRPWVAGVEASLGLGSQTTNLNGVTFTPGVAPLSFALRGDNFALRTGWDGSARARLGFLVTPSALVYATGGAAWQRYDVTSTCAELVAAGGCIFGPPAVITIGDTRVGYTIGGGIETQLVGNWFARGEPLCRFRYRLVPARPDCARRRRQFRHQAAHPHGAARLLLQARAGAQP